uniref:Uncharacterized protein n=1 Tax=Ficedula albicollis TaxID=59894 RepID=A0A803VBC4_FICAL
MEISKRRRLRQRRAQPVRGRSALTAGLMLLLGPARRCTAQPKLKLAAPDSAPTAGTTARLSPEPGSAAGPAAPKNTFHAQQGPLRRGSPREKIKLRGLP